VCPEIQGLEMKMPYADVVPLASGVGWAFSLRDTAAIPDNVCKEAQEAQAEERAAAGRDDGFDDAYAKFFNTSAGGNGTSDYGFVPYYDYADDGYGFDSTAFPTFTAFPGFSFPPGPSFPAASSFPAFPSASAFPSFPAASSFPAIPSASAFPSFPAASSFPAFPTFPAPLAADGADGTAGTAATDTVKAGKTLPQRPVVSRIPVPPRQQHGRRRLPVEIHLGDAVDASATPTRSVSATISVSSTARPKYVAGIRGCASDK
jgi:hypothetical protein